MALRVWLDDDLEDRAAPEGWTQVTTAAEAIRLLAEGRVVELSLDHGLGGDEEFGRGIDVVDRLAEQKDRHGRDLWPRDGITLHTANSYGREAMARAIERYARQKPEVTRALTAGGKLRHQGGGHRRLAVRRHANPVTLGSSSGLSRANPFA